MSEHRIGEVQAELAHVLGQLEDRQERAKGTMWCPHVPTPKQKEFIDLDADDALYGGAAGGGKSDALLMIALRGAEIPNYNAIIFRRTYRDLALPGAIMDRAAEWLRPTAAKWNDTDKVWTFPNVAGGQPPRLAFGYLDTPTDKFRYQGAEFQTICADEICQIPEHAYRYVRSRLRRNQGFPLAPFSRCAGNPGGEHMDWVKARFVDAESSIRPYIPAGIDDNPHLYNGGEEYKAALQDLDEVTRAQLLEGKWIVATQGLIYPFQNSHHVKELPDFGDRGDGWRYVLGVDLGSSIERPTTAFVVIAWHPEVPECVWVTEAWKIAAQTPTDIARQIDQLRRKYDGINRIVVDEGALGLAYGEEFRRRFAIPAYPAQKRDKQGFRKLLRGAIERGSVNIVAPTCKDLIDEARKLRFGQDGLKETKYAASNVHTTDALLYAWRESRAWSARAPETRLRRGSREYYDRASQQILDRERREFSRRDEPDDWFY